MVALETVQEMQTSSGSCTSLGPVGREGEGVGERALGDQEREHGVEI